MWKLGAENMDQCRAELLWDGPAVLRDFKLIMNLFVSSGGCIVIGELVLSRAKCRKKI